ncbi:MAG: hypothetical protein U1E77_15390 [Inhella sp.]
MRHFTILALALGLAACSPRWDWRELELADAELRARFPCKPAIQTRDGAGLAHCEQQGLRFSVAWERLERPEHLQPALAQSAPRLAGRLGLAVQGRDEAASAPAGALAFPESGAYRLQGPQGQAQLLTWVRGMRIYQALVQGKTLDAEAAHEFLQGLQHPHSR